MFAERKWWWYGSLYPAVEYSFSALKIQSITAGWMGLVLCILQLTVQSFDFQSCLFVLNKGGYNLVVSFFST